ncbi:dihydrofolate reductase family protein [Glutamicibacter sp. PS]|uniref:dihydrofolate reductase family protein n=1 Tax=Glutamicibacter sp. PS TaxID=3075634 RepID=UPI0028413E92|nr:dihydrofolate reductase family protein [Glutamicibacter sp. PS]MDR4532912.1 dihydrofolate reductase family protein [Glutamicibacter sp. PS]
MRTIIATAFISLDGVMQAPGGEPGYRNSGWTMSATEFDPAAYELKGSEQDEAGAMLLGRKSYQAFSGVWPTMTEEFPRYNAMDKYVVSTSLQPGDLVNNWGKTTLLRSAADVARVRAEDGAPLIIHGSGTLVHSLQEHQLIDRYHLLVFPVLLGAGLRLFSEADLDMQKLQLTAQATYPNGIQKQVFDVVR